MHADEFEQVVASHQRVLIADDDPTIRELLKLILSDDGYEVISAVNGHELVRLAQERAPCLILVDLMMPQMDGYEAIRQMRNDSRTAHIPMLILTGRSRSGDVVVGFESGADDYIAKPFDTSELLARVKGHLRRAAQRPVLNPLTGLPGGVLLSQELRRRLADGAALALLYADLDNFKAFNDTYGFSRGDRAILLVTNILQDVIATHGNTDDFIGHIGGDDFAVLTTPDRVKAICRTIIATFDREIRQLYPPDDRRRGYFSAADRHGVLRRFDLMSISIGVVTSQRRTFTDEEEFTRVAAEMKHYAKTQSGSSYAVDQRIASQDTSVERRGIRQRGVMIASDDGSLRAVLRSTLQHDGHLIQEASGIDALRQQLISDDRPAVVLVDAHLGEPLWKLCAEQPTTPLRPPIIVLAHDDEEVAQAQAVGMSICLRLPLPLAEIATSVERAIAGSHNRPEDATRIIGDG
jgi:DNA-binding response OmpR family regulator